MQMQEIIHYKVKEAVNATTVEVTQNVEQRMVTLIDILIKEIRIDDLSRVAVDKDYREKVMADLGIEQEIGFKYHGFLLSLLCIYTPMDNGYLRIWCRNLRGEIAAKNEREAANH